MPSIDSYTKLCIVSDGITDGNTTFNESQLKSLKQVGIMVESNGGRVFNDLLSIAQYVNKQW